MIGLKRRIGWAALAASIGCVVSANAQNVQNGEQVFKKCRICHQVGDNAKNAVGPVLNGIIGRQAGTIEGFRYSPANKSSGVTWTEENMFKYLENPKAFIPGTIMVFPGLPEEQDRKDVIAYLKSFSK